MRPFDHESNAQPMQPPRQATQCFLTVLLILSCCNVTHCYCYTLGKEMMMMMMMMMLTIFTYLLSVSAGVKCLLYFWEEPVLPLTFVRTHLPRAMLGSASVFQERPTSVIFAVRHNYTHLHSSNCVE